jgi:hypothetical protein
VACPALYYFSTLSQKRHDFYGKSLWKTKCVFWFSPKRSSETNLILRITERDISNVRTSSSDILVIIVSFKINEILIFSTYLKNISNTKFHENPSVGSTFVSDGRTDSQTDLTKLIVAFHNFVNAPKSTRTVYQSLGLHVQWFMYSVFMYSVFMYSVPLIVSPGMAAASHTKLTSAGISCDIFRSHGHDKMYTQ